MEELLIKFRVMEDNKLIAEFMGWTERTDPTERWFGCFKTQDGVIHKNTPLDPLLFHSDWNWLMDVVDKIESLNFSVEMNRQEEGDYQCLIVKKEIIVQTFSSNKMESVYQAVVKFIKWYEQNNN